MIAKELISDIIPPLKTSDTGVTALLWMDEFKVKHLPIVNNQNFLGLISENDILDMNQPEEVIGAHPLSLIRPFVDENKHIYETLKLFSELKLSILPVLDIEGNYLGVISEEKIIEGIATMTAVNMKGSILILEINHNDYYLSQIANIVETNDARILSMYITPIPETTKLILTLKINLTDLSRVIQTFNRYNYNVAASYNEVEHLDDLKQRLDMFLNYIK